MGSERRQEAERRGRKGEALAALLSRCKGYRILGQRVRTRAGEIDLVAKSPSGVVCFVVSRRGLRTGWPPSRSASASAPASCARRSFIWPAGRPRKACVSTSSPWFRAVYHATCAMPGGRMICERAL